ncbi:MAG: DUF1499 domain-containing protein [Cyanobacteria bacterium P01_H01_bin.121]
MACEIQRFAQYTLLNFPVVCESFNSKGIKMVIRLMMTVMLLIGLLAPLEVVAMPLSTIPNHLHPAPTTTTVIALQGRLFSLPGQPPDSLGRQAGSLADCPSTPNCVSTTATDPEHTTEPIYYTSDATVALANIKKILTELPRAEIIDSDDQYVYAQFTSEWLGFVDDVEFAIIPEQQEIAVRSASRLGQSDLGVNRKRVENIRAAFTGLSAQQGTSLIDPEAESEPAVTEADELLDSSEESELAAPTPDQAELELLTELAEETATTTAEAEIAPTMSDVQTNSEMALGVSE